MSHEEVQAVARWLNAVGRNLDRRECQPNAHQEVWGEVFLRVVANIDCKGVTAIRSLEAFVRDIGWKEFRRAFGRERKETQKYTPTESDAVLETGVVPLSRQLPSSCTNPLDELVRQEELRVLAAFLDQLSEIDAALVWTLPRGELSECSLGELARQSRKSVRTLQRRRERLTARLRHILVA